MTSIAILGATGSLGSLVARQAAAAGNSVSLLVRSPGKLPPEVAARARVVVTADLITTPPATLTQFAEGHDVLVCCAGLVTEGQKFVALVDRIASVVEALPNQARPLCCSWPALRYLTSMRMDVEALTCLRSAAHIGRIARISNACFARI